MKHSLTLTAVMAAAVFVGGGAMIGCEGTRSNRIDRSELDPDLALVSTAKQIYVGEVVTVTTRTANLLGHDSDIRWNTTGGELQETEEGRVARVRFDRPGTYIVSAQLMIDGEPYRTDSVTVEVLPLR